MTSYNLNTSISIRSRDWTIPSHLIIKAGTTRSLCNLSSIENREQRDVLKEFMKTDEIEETLSSTFVL